MEIKLRGRKEPEIVKIAKKLDAFRQIPEEYVDRSRIGGALSIISRILIIFLIRREFLYYLNSNLVFQFIPDVDLDGKLKMHIDLTVLMPCVNVGADVTDPSEDSIHSFGELKKEDTWWDLCPTQRDHFERLQHINNFLREEYHSIAELLFRDVLLNREGQTVTSMPERTAKPNKPYDACRLHGVLTINKVAGNLHIMPGRSLHLPQGHIHINSIFDEIKYNFSHRIVRFSFGDHSTGLVQPLEGDELIVHESTAMVQYFIDIVPTEIHGFMSTVDTVQYSVKTNLRNIDHDKGSHGTPGLFFKYDTSALKIKVRQNRDKPTQFFIRLCSIISGIVVIVGMIKTIINKIHKLIMKFITKMSPEASHYMKMTNGSSNYNSTNYPPHSVPPQTTPVFNDLLMNANQMSATRISLAIKK